MNFFTKAWKGMLDSDCFVAAGWVHDLALHLFNTNSSSRFLIKGKVWICLNLMEVYIFCNA